MFLGLSLFPRWLYLILVFLSVFSTS